MNKLTSREERLVDHLTKVIAQTIDTSKDIEQTIRGREIVSVKVDFDADANTVIAQLSLWLEDKKTTEKAIIPLTVADVKEIVLEKFLGKN